MNNRCSTNNRYDREVFNIDNDDDEITYNNKANDFCAILINGFIINAQKVEESYSNYLNNFNRQNHVTLYQNNNDAKAVQDAVSDLNLIISTYEDYMDLIKTVFLKNHYADKSVIADATRTCLEVVCNLNSDLAENNQAARKINDKILPYADSQLERYMAQQEHDLYNVMQSFIDAHVFVLQP